MATGKEYLQFIVDQLGGAPELTWRPMMGEYILYYRGRIVGGLYDGRLLVKPVPAAVRRMPDAPREVPYPGGREMLLVEQVDDGEFLRELWEEMWEQLPAK